MKILNLYSITGSNIYSYKPVIVMDVDLEQYTRIYTDEIPNFIPTILNYFPGLTKHHCCKSYPGGFVERMERGTLLGHVMEHLALELQTLIAKPVYFGKTRFVEEVQGYRIVLSYYHETLGLKAAEFAFKAIQDIILGKEVKVSDVLCKLEKEYTENSYGASTQAIIKAAQERKIPVIPLSQRSSLIQLGYGAMQKRVQATITQNTTSISVDLACDKLEAKELFGDMGLPVARGYLATKVEDALEIMQRISGPVVVKPVNGNQGKGVSLNITTSDELRRAYEVGQRYSKEILIEEYIKGNDYRLTVVDGQLVAAAHRLPPVVIGDGLSTIRQLIQKINSDQSRGEGHAKPLTRIKTDQVVLMNLFKQNLSLDSIIPEGAKVTLRENGNLSTGGTAYDVTDMVHPENQLLAERAASLIGLDVAGIDLRTEDISRPISRYGGAIIEINAAPGIRMHHYPTAGKVRDVAGKIVDMLFPAGNGRIPIFSITGTNGKTTTTRLIQHILLQTGKNVGMTTTDGIFVNRNRIAVGDTTGPQSAKILLKDPTVEIAVLETARGGIIRAGLGYDQSDVGIVLNVSNDHLGLAGIETLEEMARVKSLIVETVSRDGICVLNGDNQYTQNMAEKCLGKVIYFSSKPEQSIILEHIRSGGRAVVAQGGVLEVWDGEEVIPLISINQIPMTWHGKAKHQVENVLAAVAGLYGFGVDLELIKAGLKSFDNDINTNPGRLNLIEANGWRLILDYGHNFAGYKAVIDFVNRLGYQRLLGVVGVPGDRSDNSIREVGRLVGDNFHQVWIKEDTNLRGRKSGEVAQLFFEGVASGIYNTTTEIVLKENEALKDMLTNLREGDVGVVFYEKEPEKLMRLIAKHIEELGDNLQGSPENLNKSKVLAANSSR